MEEKEEDEEEEEEEVFRAAGPEVGSSEPSSQSHPAA